MKIIGSEDPSDDDYTSIRSNGLGPLHGHYPVYVLPSDRRNVDDLRGLSEVTKQPTKRLKNPFYKQTVDSIGSGYKAHVASVENQRVEDTSAKIKKNFDEIDKTSASFSTLNQLL
uniref:Uncharacterized protein n=1 Tax=Glossina morsitans morsitans TaxID=37546 RepID=A0A1B0G7D7_GLOMM